MMTYYISLINSINSTLYPAWYDLIFKETWKYIPGPLLEYVRYLPTREYRGFRLWLDSVREFSRGLIKQSMVKGDGNDIMSVHLRANGSSNPKNKMADDELVDQIACVTRWACGFSVLRCLLVRRLQHVPCCRA